MINFYRFSTMNKNKQDKPQNPIPVIIDIDVDALNLFYDMYKDEINSNHKKYMKFIRGNKTIYNDYLTLCDGITSMTLHSNTVSQMGGSPGLVAGIVIGSFVITSVVACILWHYLNKGAGCKKEYDLYSTKYPDKIPAVEALLQTILPNKWLDDEIRKGKNITDAINESGEYLDRITETFQIFDESVGSTSAKVAKSVSKITLSFGAAFLSVGMGGDKIVNIPFFISKAVKMTSKTYNKLKNVGQQIMNELNECGKNIRKSGKSIESVLDKTSEINDSIKSNVADLKNYRSIMTFIYDLFNIDFEGGPNESKCKVNHVIKHYVGFKNDENIENIKNIKNTGEISGGSIENKSKQVYMLLCAMNDIYVEINDVVIEFIGTSIDLVVPDSMGLGGTLAPLLKSYSYEIYSGVRSQITDGYEKIPGQYRGLIENPLTMKKYLLGKFKTYTLGLSDLVIPDSVKDHLGSGIDVLANGINKGLGMLFMFLNVFITFSEINSGINEAMIDSNINIEKLLKKCTKQSLEKSITANS